MIRGMRILIVGASGVLGRATLPHLRGHELIGTTRNGPAIDAEAMGSEAGEELKRRGGPGFLS